MDNVPENASVTVDARDGQWIVRVAEGASVEERTFDSEDLATDFAHGQRLRLGLIPQQDVS